MKRIHLAIAMGVWAIVLSACGSSSSSSSGGGGTGSGSGATGGTANCPAPASGASLDGQGASLSIGSKGFAEEQIAAEIAKQALQKHNFVVDYSDQGKDPNIGKDLQSGKIGLLWQYTGTELGEYLQADKIPGDLHQAFVQTQQLDDAKGICWVGETPMNDTNGIAVKTADIAKYGSTLSDLTAYMKQHSDVKVCVASEFKSRPQDGAPGLAAAYDPIWSTFGFQLVDSTAESKLASGDCDAGEVFTTDSAITAKGLTVLKDDKSFFPADNLGLEVRSEVLKKYPQIAAIINPIAQKLTTAVFLSLNKMAEVDNMKPADVARTWLAQNGF